MLAGSERSVAERLRLGTLGLLLSAFVGLLGVLAPGARAANAGDRYVALGDSYTAGPLIPPPNPDFPGCLKSLKNYPHLVAADRNLQLKDASCSGAKTDDMTKSQNVDPDPDPPPQFSALNSTTKVVTFTIGGNDIGFTEIVRSCASPVNQGTPCQDRYVKDGRDEISARITATAPKVAKVLQGIHQHAKNAAVYVINYLPILPEHGDTGCHPQVPITDGDVPYLRSKEEELNKMLADQAAADTATNKAKLVDAYTAGDGKDACQLPTVRWVEPAVPVNPAAPLHPNLAGMEGTEKAVVSAFG